MFGSKNLFCPFLLVAFAGLANAYPSVWQLNYTDVHDDDVALMGYMALPPALAAEDDSTDDSASIGDLPAVVILPDWDNVNDYEITRAKMIAEELGYIAFTADIYGADMHDIKDFAVKVEQATKYRSDPELFNSRIKSAIATIKEMPFVDANKVAIIGYCLGGTGVLGYSFDHTVGKNSSYLYDIVGGVSFHGGLMDFPVTGEMASPVLVLSGGKDDAGTAVEDLENKLKQANATWQITRYSGVYHGFTKFDASAYNEWVDKRSWLEMSTFLAELFGELEYGTTEPALDVEYMVELLDPPEIAQAARMSGGNEPKSMVMVETIPYYDDFFALEGYLALPPMENGESRPALLILPDWDGVNGPTGYESERAVMAAKEGGYVAMVADIYGTEFTNVDDMPTRIELATKYRSDPALFVSRIRAAIDVLLAHDAVDSSRIFVAGYCLGGTGAIDYAFSSKALENVRAVIPIHGGLNPLRAIRTDAVKPYVLVLSGGVDDAHGNTTELEAHLDGASATWEITRYSNARHGFTKWGTGPFSAYDTMADSRSWWSMMSLIDSLSDELENTTEKEEMEEHDHLEEHSHSHDESNDKTSEEKMSEESSGSGFSVFGSAVSMATVFIALTVF